MPVPTLFDLCPDGWFVPIPGGVFFQPGRDTGLVDLMGLVKAMRAVRPASGDGVIVLSDAALSRPESIGILRRTVADLASVRAGVTLGALPGSTAGPDSWLAVTDTIGAQAYLPHLPGMESAPRLIPVDAQDHAVAQDRAVAVRVLPQAQAAAREALYTAARLAADTSTAPLARLRELTGALPLPEFLLAAGMVLTGAPDAWDPARVTPLSVDEVRRLFPGGSTTALTAPAALATTAAAPGTTSLLHTTGASGPELTWLAADAGRLWAVRGPGDVTPADDAFLSRAVARGATITPFPPAAQVLQEALDALPAWNRTDPDCADRVAFVLGRLGFPMAATVPEGLRARDAVADRFGGHFLPPGDAGDLTAMRVGALTPVWLVPDADPAHLVLLHRLSSRDFLLVETQDRVTPITVDALTGTVRLIGDVDGRLLQMDLRTRTPVRSSMPVADSAVDGWRDPATGPRTPGMAGGAQEIFPDGSADHFFRLAQAAGWRRPQGALSRTLHLSESTAPAKTARDFVKHVVSGRKPVPDALPVDGTHLYRAVVNGTEVTVRAALDRQGRLVRAMTPLPFEAALAGRGLGWLLTDLARAGWSVTQGRTESVDRSRMRIVIKDASVRTFLNAHFTTLQEPGFYDHLLFRTADPEIHAKLRAEAVRLRDRLLDTEAPDWLTHWAGLARMLTQHAGVPDLRDIRREDPDSHRAGLFSRDDWSMGLQADRPLDEMLSTLVHEITHVEQVSMAARALRTQPWREWDIHPEVLSELLRTAVTGDRRHPMAASEWDGYEGFTYDAPAALASLHAIRTPAPESVTLPDSRLRGRLRADRDRWQRVEAQVLARVRMVALEASAYRVQETFDAAGTIRDWSTSVSFPLPHGFDRSPLGRAGVLIHPAGRPPAAAPDRRASADRPLVVVVVPDGDDPRALIRHLAAEAPENALVELVPGLPMSLRTAIELTRLLGPDQRLAIGVRAVDRPEGPWAQHFVAYGGNHRPAPGPFASYFQVLQEPADLLRHRTGIWATGQVRHPVLPGFDLVTVGKRLWIGPAGAEPAIEDGDPPVVVGAPGAETPWRVWRVAQTMVTEYAVAAGRQLTPDLIRIHRPVLMPSARPDVSRAAVHAISAEDRRLFGRLFGRPDAVDKERLAGRADDGAFTAYHLVDALLDTSEVKVWVSSPDDEAVAVADALARDVIGRDGPEARRELLALTYLTALAHGVTAVTAERMRQTARLLAAFTPAEALRRGRDWVADTLHALDPATARPGPDDARLGRLLRRALEKESQPRAEPVALHRVAAPVESTHQPVVVLGGWRSAPAAGMREAVRVHAARAGRPVIAVDLAGPPDTVTTVVAELRDVVRWHARLGPAPLVAATDATAHGRALFDRAVAELRPVTLTPFDRSWVLRDEDGRTVTRASALAENVFQAAGALPRAASPLPAALTRWLSLREFGPAEEHHREHADALHTTGVADDLAWLAGTVPDDARLAAFRTALEVARRAGGVPDARLRPVATSFLTVEPAYDPATRGPAPVTFVYDYLTATGGRRERFPWDGLLFQLLMAGELSGEQALSLIRATAVTPADHANAVVLEVLLEIRDLPEALLGEDPMTHPRLRELLGRLGRVAQGAGGSYADCVDPVDRTAWVGRIDGYRARLTASGDARRGELLGVAAYVLSNC
ncbi:hypothetical protein ACIA8K_31010 [Catenuloplanes sp. NPDC051500]|uniref:hypothetical protein n=1 Tax=Catenuloplanes sp. NPDC051500 TaxID=3363959 RepID=UPI00379BA144